MSVLIYHNILWSKYKGGVFSALYKLASEINFIQIAETEGDRVGLSGVDMSYHTYPHQLLHQGKYEDIGAAKLANELFWHTLKAEADLVVLAGYHRIEYWAQLFAAFLSGKKVAVFCDSTANDKPFSLLKAIPKWIFFHAVDGFFAYGERSRNYICSYGIKPEKVFFRCQAAALPHHYSPDSAITTRVVAQQSQDHPVFLYVGRLSHEKDLHILLDAFHTVVQQYSDAKLRLVGSGPLRESLEAQAKQLGLNDSVVFTGGKTINELEGEYAKATCMVLPSNSEPWGLVVNEALSYGCPVVVSEACGCVPELVIDGFTGFSFRTGNTAELALRMLSCVNEFTDQQQTATNCVSHIGRFSPENAARQILAGLDHMLSE